MSTVHELAQKARASAHEGALRIPKWFRNDDGFWCSLSSQPTQTRIFT